MYNAYWKVQPQDASRKMQGSVGRRKEGDSYDSMAAAKANDRVMRWAALNRSPQKVTLLKDGDNPLLHPTQHKFREDGPGNNIYLRQ